MVSMDTSNGSARLSGSSYIPQNDTRSSVSIVPKQLADGNSIQVLSSSNSEDQLSDHNEDGAQLKFVSLLDMFKAPKASCRSGKSSSAAAEKVFSFLQSSFEKQQEQSIEDYIQLSVMM